MNKRLIGLIAVAVLVAVGVGAAYFALGGDDDERRAAALSTTRSYTAGIVGLELDGVSVGTVRSVEGCDLTAPVVTAADGVDKQSGAPKYTPCKVAFGTGMKPALYQWVSDTLGGKVNRRSVSIIVYDLNYKAVRRLDLAEAMISRFVIPALSAASTEAVVFEMTLDANSVRRVTPSGSTTSGVKGKAMLASNFKLTGTGLEEDLKRVSAVDAWSFEVTPAPVGETRVAASGPPQLGDLTLTINAPGGAQFDTWIESLLKGSPTEKAITLTLLDSTMATPLVDVSFGVTGLVGADLLGQAESSDAISKRRFSTYVEQATIKFNAAIAS